MSLFQSRSRGNHHLDGRSSSRLQRLVQAITTSSGLDDYLTYLNWHIHDPQTTRGGNFSILNVHADGSYELQDINFSIDEVLQEGSISLDQCKTRLSSPFSDATEGRIIVVPEDRTSFNDDFLNLLCTVFDIQPAFFWTLVRSSKCWSSPTHGRHESRPPEALRNLKLWTPYSRSGHASIGYNHLLKVNFAQALAEHPPIVLVFAQWLPRQVPGLIVAEHHPEGAFSAVQHILEDRDILQNASQSTQEWARKSMLSTAIAMVLESRSLALTMDSSMPDQKTNPMHLCLAACLQLQIVFARYCSTRHDELFHIWSTRKIITATDEKDRADWYGLPTDWTYLCDCLVEFKRTMKAALKFIEDTTSSSSSHEDRLTDVFEQFEAQLDEIKMLKDRTSERLALEASRASLQASSASIEMARESVLDSKRTRLLTILAFIFVPLSLATSIFGMNVQQINSTGNQIWVFIVVAVALSLIAFAALMIVDTASSARENWQRRRDVTNELYDSKAQAVKTLFTQQRWHSLEPSMILFFLTNGRYGRELIGQEQGKGGKWWTGLWRNGIGLLKEVRYLFGFKRVDSGSGGRET